MFSICGDTRTLNTKSNFKKVKNDVSMRERRSEYLRELKTMFENVLHVNLEPRRG